MPKIELQPSYVLHTRPFKESSLIAEILTKDLGRQSFLVKGAKRPKSKLRGLITPFAPLTISGVGRNELLTLTHAEARQAFVPLAGAQLISGLYINELLYKLLPRAEGHPALFTRYESLMVDIKEGGAIEPILRYFEYALLKELGYGFELFVDNNEQPIESDAFYDFDPNEGLIKVHPQHLPNVQGKTVLQFAHQQTDGLEWASLKWLMRTAMQAVLGANRIHTRELVRFMGEQA